MTELRKMIDFLDQIIYSSENEDEIEMIQAIQQKLIDSHYYMMENNSLRLKAKRREVMNEDRIHGRTEL